jgi:hypothetical protein
MKRETFNVDITEKVRLAHDFARDSHMGRTTIGTNKHYNLHLAKTAEIFMNHGATEIQLIATLLKDILKLTDVRLDQIKEMFGMSVAVLVKELTIDTQWNKITDVSIAMIKISESIDLLSRLDSNRLSLEYKCGILADARTLLAEVKPLGLALSLIDPDLSIMDILTELQKSYDVSLEVVDVEEEVV